MVQYGLSCVNKKETMNGKKKRISKREISECFAYEQTTQKPKWFIIYNFDDSGYYMAVSHKDGKLPSNSRI